MFVFGLLLLAIGFVLLFKYPVFGACLMIFSFLFTTTYYGTEIDIQHRKIRTIICLYGLKKGEWEDLDTYPFLSVLKSKSGYTINSSRSSQSYNYVESKFDVCLLTLSHRKKIVIQRFGKQEQAEKLMREMAETIYKEVVTYAPVVSERTRSRRSNRRKS